MQTNVMPRDLRPCEMCDGDDTAGKILLCDLCSLPVHAHCVGFTGPVEGDWFCNGCSGHNPANEEGAPVAESADDPSAPVPL
jgi:hypothetical protein